MLSIYTKQNWLKIVIDMCYEKSFCLKLKVTITILDKNKKFFASSLFRNRENKIFFHQSVVNKSKHSNNRDFEYTLCWTWISGDNCRIYSTRSPNFRFNIIHQAFPDVSIRFFEVQNQGIPDSIKINFSLYSIRLFMNQECVFERILRHEIFGLISHQQQ